MAGRSGVTVDVRPLTASLSKLTRRLGEMGDQQARRAAAEVAAQAAAAVPRRTGALADTIHTTGTTVSYGGNLAYARWIEFGGQRPHPRPYVPKGRYFFPAVSAASQRFIRGVQSGTASAIGKV